MKQAIVLVSVVLIGATFACQTKADDTRSHSSLSEVIPNSCEYTRAMDACCPVYCATKKKEGATRAADTFLACASGFGCSKGSISGVRCELGDNCK